MVGAVRLVSSNRLTLPLNWIRLLAVMLEQQTDLQPTQIMTDTGAYSDVVFDLFRRRGTIFARAWRTLAMHDSGALSRVPIMVRSTGSPDRP